MKKITKIDSTNLAAGILATITQMMADGVETPEFPIARFEALIVARHGVSKSDAEKVTEEVLNTGIIKWNIHNNSFCL